MKAVAKLRPEPGAMALIDMAPPVRKPGEVLIQISAGGICGTDVAIWKWHEAVVSQYAPQFPLIVGHEFAGTVLESDSPRVQPGAVVAVNPQIACGHCRFCGLGRPTLCDDRRLMGGRINGGWTEFVSVPEWNVHPLPEGVDSAVAPLLEPLSVATHAVLERVPVRVGDVVVVIGAGPIGILCAILALSAGARYVMITGVVEDAGRLEIARQIGAIPVNIDAQDPMKMLYALQAEGADIVYETSGVASTLEQAVGHGPQRWQCRTHRPVPCGQHLQEHPGGDQGASSDWFEGLQRNHLDIDDECVAPRGARCTEAHHPSNTL